MNILKVGIPTAIMQGIMSVMGIFINGLIPIIEYNYGAKKEKRIHETIRCAFIYAVFIMTVILIVLEFIPDRILMLFDASDQMLKLGIPAVRIMSVSFFVSSIGIIFVAIFQGFSYLVRFCHSRSAVNPLWNMVIQKNQEKYHHTDVGTVTPDGYTVFCPFKLFDGCWNTGS